MGNGERHTLVLQGRRNRHFVFWIGKRKQQRDGNCFGPSRLHSSLQIPKIGLRRLSQNLAVATRTFVYAEAQIRWNERLNPVEEEVVELGTGLPPDLDDILETS